MSDELPVGSSDKLREIQEKYEQMAADARQRLKAIDDQLKAASSGEMDAVAESPDAEPPGDQT